MKITNFKKSISGVNTFDVTATEEETGVLVNVGLDTLVSVGMLSMEELEEKGSTQISLENLDETAFFKA